MPHLSPCCSSTSYGKGFVLTASEVQTTSFTTKGTSRRKAAQSWAMDELTGKETSASPDTFPYMTTAYGPLSS